MRLLEGVRAWKVVLRRAYQMSEQDQEESISDLQEMT